MSGDSPDSAVSTRRVSMTVTAYLTGHLGGWYDLQSRPDGGENWSVPDFAVDEHSVTDLPPEALTRDDWDEITGTVVGRLGKEAGGRMAAEWMRVALGVQQAQAEAFRLSPGKTIGQLAAEQRVSPVESLDELAGPGDVPVLEMDAFLDAIHERCDPGRGELERRLRVTAATIARARQLAFHWSGASGRHAEAWRQASADLHATLDGTEAPPTPRIPNPTPGSITEVPYGQRAAEIGARHREGRYAGPDPRDQEAQAAIGHLLEVVHEQDELLSGRDLRKADAR